MHGTIAPSWTLGSRLCSTVCRNGPSSIRAKPIERYRSAGVVQQVARGLSHRRGPAGSTPRDPGQVAARELGAVPRARDVARIANSKAYGQARRAPTVHTMHQAASLRSQPAGPVPCGSTLGPGISDDTHPLTSFDAASEVEQNGIGLAGGEWFAVGEHLGLIRSVGALLRWYGNPGERYKEAS